VSVELYDDEFPDLEATLTAGGIRFGPNMHPARLVLWVVACYEHPNREIRGESGERFTGEVLVSAYLRPGRVGGTSAAELRAAVMARWG
jgi:hypothetical protein